MCRWLIIVGVWARGGHSCLEEEERCKKVAFKVGVGQAQRMAGWKGMEVCSILQVRVRCLGRVAQRGRVEVLLRGRRSKLEADAEAEVVLFPHPVEIVLESVSVSRKLGENPVLD